MLEKEYICTNCEIKFTKKFKYDCYLKNYENKPKRLGDFCTVSCSTKYRNKIYPSGMKGKNQSKEAKNKISKANKGKSTGFAVTSKEMNQRQKVLKTGFYNSKQQTQSSIKSRLSLKNKHQWNNIFFDSKSELEFAKLLILHKFLDTIIPSENFQIKIGSRWHDFLIQNVYVEFHPYNFGKGTIEDYYNQRKENLIKYNIENKIIIVKSFNDFLIKIQDIKSLK